VRRLTVLLAALALAGCGVLDDERPLDPAVFGPPEAAKNVARAEIVPPKLQQPAPDVARALDRGEVGVVDPAGVVSIEPESLDTASDVTLEGVEWTAWSRAGANGTAQVSILSCQPTCAAGSHERVPATITLTGVKVCDGRRYFERGEVSIDPKDSPSKTGASPATYLRAPC
jgi:hypothetical protein